MKNTIVLIALISILLLPTLVYAARDTETITEYVDSVKADVPMKVVIESDVMHLKQIDFVAKEYLGDIQFNIANLKYRPSTSYAPDYDVYEYFEIIPGDFTADNLKSIDITFYVLEEWLLYRNHDTSEVVLLRYAGSAGWEELKTEFTGKAKELYYFTAESPGFQYFAIAGRKGAKVIEPTPIPEQQVIVSRPKQMDKQSSTNYLLILLAFGLIVVIAFFALGKKKRRAKLRKKRKKRRK